MLIFQLLGLLHPASSGERIAKVLVVSRVVRNKFFILFGFVRFSENNSYSVRYEFGSIRLKKCSLVRVL